MYLSREIKFGLLLLLGLNLLVALSSISLLERLKPAVEVVLRENVPSTEATEIMLAALNMPSPASVEKKDRFFSALKRARENITEENEIRLIANIGKAADAALEGNPAAVSGIVADLLKLGDVNRAAMMRADQHVKRLGTAGAWAIAILGFISFMCGLLVLDRFSRRIKNPIQELSDVITSWKEGNHHRRYHQQAAAREIETIGSCLNSLLNQIAEMAGKVRQKQDPGMGTESRDREIIAGLLDVFVTPAFVVAQEGALLSANSKGLAALGRKGGAEIRDLIGQAPKSRNDSRLSRVEPIAQTDYWLCQVKIEPDGTAK